MNTWLRPAKYEIHFSICCHLTQTTLPQNYILSFGMLAVWLCSTSSDFNEEYLTEYHTTFLTMHGSGKWPWGRGLCNICDQCWATPSLSHLITGWTLIRLTGAGQSSFCSLAIAVSHVAKERWLGVFWILLIRSRYRSAHINILITQQISNNPHPTLKQGVSQTTM